MTGRAVVLVEGGWLPAGGVVGADRLAGRSRAGSGVAGRQDAGGGDSVIFCGGSPIYGRNSRRNSYFFLTAQTPGLAVVSMESSLSPTARRNSVFVLPGICRMMKDSGGPNAPLRVPTHRTLFSGQSREYQEVLGPRGAVMTDRGTQSCSNPFEGASPLGRVKSKTWFQEGQRTQWDAVPSIFPLSVRKPARPECGCIYMLWVRPLYYSVTSKKG